MGSIPIHRKSIYCNPLAHVGSPNQFSSKVAWVVRPGEQTNGSQPVGYSGKQRFKLVYKTIKHLINNKVKDSEKMS